MKLTPVVLELKKRGIPQFLIHTGQHYDENMSRVFIEELGLPEPDSALRGNSRFFGMGRPGGGLRKRLNRGLEEK
jgi:UDP-N-acetylglucosamine 2-epimerase